jgi:hypothetical protein
MSLMLKRLPVLLGWNRTSYALLSGFLALLLLIGYVWRPLLEAYLATYNPAIPFWYQVDWLLLGIWVVMTLLIMANANIKTDWLITIVGFFGGLVIESWGTQTWLWSYYTYERPPLWIIPAWPVASLSIDRLYRLLRRWTQVLPESVFVIFYWLTFLSFYLIMWFFVLPTFDKSLTVMALLLCAFLILTPTDRRAMVLIFLAGSGLGYFLERWGTTRQCWTYYTLETPPVFAVFAHGMAAVAFWRVAQLYSLFTPKILKLLQGFTVSRVNNRCNSL